MSKTNPLSRKTRAAIFLSSLDEDMIAGIHELLHDQDPICVNIKSDFTQEDIDHLFEELREPTDVEITAVLNMLTPEKSTQLFGTLPAEKHFDFIKEIFYNANHENTNALYKAIGRKLKLSDLKKNADNFGGLKQAITLLANANPEHTQNIIDILHPEIAKILKRKRFAFEDLALVNDKGIQNMLRQTEHSDLTIALKTASEDLKDKVFNNMSQRATELVKEDMEYLGPVRMIDIMQTQQDICEIISDLIETGDAIFFNSDGSGDLVE